MKTEGLEMVRNTSHSFGCAIEKACNHYGYRLFLFFFGVLY